MKKMSPWKLSLIPLAMFGFGFALVPLYDVFCAVTGLNGKNFQVLSVDEASRQDLNHAQRANLQFLADADSRDLWQFKPENKTLELQAGKLITTYYELTNPYDYPVTIQAVPSVAPGVWAEYLVKIECFCFTQQVVPAKTKVKLPLQVTLSAKAPEEVNHLSLSYRLYQSETLGGTF
ncbi:cytochrome c oxidase assembly protein [Oceaniserpentilla sp. 4NH20-0058]|uniref:cytochrome c oxidase assembly protein n=1 Tax=Oceaniserpentilla sp. 4NH20-0058 TaxID=3127660 RepID=UPI00310A5327